MKMINHSKHAAKTTLISTRIKYNFKVRGKIKININNFLLKMVEICYYGK